MSDVRISLTLIIGLITMIGQISTSSSSDIMFTNFHYVITHTRTHMMDTQAAWKQNAFGG